ncbi:MAG: ABC transporter ATP-binding protein [Parvularcula sp.]|nr:ABC transporter ATP-binding protein [Parvularcula sp.]
MIEIDGLGKRYRLGQFGAGSLREDMERWWKKRRGQAEAPRKNEFWALRDVSFSVSQGEVVGIIGRNGAGKSTLLKMLSRISEPTEGQIRLRGRVGSLLEVGTGFHPQLTGRENTYLNGAILGMTRREVDRQFDAIVDFSECEKFIDTPVKRYSSGMRVRLAFAVAAHLEPEILIIDEVLAVGDAAFQQKCIGKMEDVASHGRTVLFVSHNLATIQQLCTRGVVLEGGKVAADCSTEEAVDIYTQNMQRSATTKRSERDIASKEAYIESASITGSDAKRGNVLIAGENARFRINVRARQNLEDVRCILTIFNPLGVRATVLASSFFPNKFPVSSEGITRFDCEIERLPFPEGPYFVEAMLVQNNEILDFVENAGTFQVGSDHFFECGVPPPAKHCPVMVAHSWKTEIGSAADCRKVGVT